jgi:hypothetical protein
MEITMRQKTSKLVVALLVAVAAHSLGCAFGEIRPHDPFAREFALEEAHKTYTDNVRWSKFEEAAKHMKTDDRSQFLSRMPEFEEVRFTDWKAQPFVLDSDLRNSSIDVEYTGYTLASPFEITVHETQTWVRDGKGNGWTVVSYFHDLDTLAGN